MEQPIAGCGLCVGLHLLNISVLVTGKEAIPFHLLGAMAESHQTLQQGKEVSSGKSGILTLADGRRVLRVSAAGLTTPLGLCVGPT